jgi:UMF1 family MFS transporter
MYTVVVTAVFPVWYRNYVAADLSDDAKRTSFAWATTLVLVLSALLSPLLGALADARGSKKRWFTAFVVLGTSACAALAFVQQGQAALACTLFALANLGAVGSFVFYDAMLVDVAEPKDYDALSTSGYALGYLGGGLALAAVAASLLYPILPGSESDPQLAVRASMLFVALWWAVFSLPLLLRVKETRHDTQRDTRVSAALRALWQTLTELRQRRDAFIFLLAFFAYNDGIGTIIRMATTFGDEKGLAAADMLKAILLVQVVGIPATLLFGRIARSTGAKPMLFVAIAVYVIAALLARSMETAADFWLLAGLIGCVQGGAQALSRSLYASMVPAHRQAEFFGLFSTLEKFAGILGPLAFAVLPSTDAALLSVIGFFLLGAGLLSRVDVERGRAAHHQP